MFCFTARALRAMATPPPLPTYSLQLAESVLVTQIYPAPVDELNFFYPNLVEEVLYEEPEECEWCRNFLIQMPQSDRVWNGFLNSRSDLNRLFRRLTLAHIIPAIRAQMEWIELFETCTVYLDCLIEGPGVVCLYSLVFVATCHIALLSGCSEQTVNDAMRAFIKRREASTEDLSDEELGEMRNGVLKGIKLLSDCAEMIGYRAFELPLHVQDPMPMFQHYSSRCHPALREKWLDAYRPTTPLPSDKLFIPSLVYELLGRSRSGWVYEAIRQALQPEVYGLPRHLDVDMGEVLEAEEAEPRD